VIDADKIARDVVEPGLPAWKEIVAVFGEGILKPNREINREALRNIIFNDSGKRHLLNQCTHPHIQTAMLKQALWHFLRGEWFVVLDTPLLFESGRLVSWMKKIIVVYCSEEQQVERLIQRNSLSEDDAKLRIAAQIPLREKVHRADYVIDNSQSLEETKKQVKQVIRRLNKVSWWCGLYKWIAVLCFFSVLFYFLIFQK
jgi:dephospho-CoA kinase